MPSGGVASRREPDPLRLAIVRGRLQQVVDEMDLVQVRTAFSPIVTQAGDRANALIDASTGEVVVQGSAGLPIFIVAMQASARHVLADLGPRMRPGDVIVLNDPYLAGTHLEDLKLLRPIFDGTEMVAILASTGHYVDVGGAVAGGSNPGAANIFEEGLQIPPVWLYRGGELQDDMLRLILSNTRLAESMRGDIMAQVNALETGARRLAETTREFGTAFVQDCFRSYADRSEQLMRNCLRRIPSGAYSFSDSVEFGDDDLTLQITITVGDKVEIDFAGSSPATNGPMNLSPVTTTAAVLVAFKHLFPEIPINGGCFRPFEFSFPSDCFVNAAWPDALDGYSETSIRVLEAVFGALDGSVAGRGYAASCGTSAVLTLAGPTPGGFIAATFPLPGGSGASIDGDGLQFAPTPIGRGGLVGVEHSEHDLPIRWTEIALREGSGGAGLHRGADGVVFSFRLLAPLSVKVMADRSRHRPFGVRGGDAAENLLIEVRQGSTMLGGPGVSRLTATPLEAGDQVTIRTPGGGGFARPGRPGDLTASGTCRS